jgi:hypothetical protein
MSEYTSGNVKGGKAPVFVGGQVTPNERGHLEIPPKSASKVYLLSGKQAKGAFIDIPLISNQRPLEKAAKVATRVKAKQDEGHSMN